ncbi:MAG: transporter substrate-binding domain-containing protein [Clostridia bacterium]|nr:transporter substrate-binding domain-containing protein [Clostridia bacterium]
MKKRLLIGLIIGLLAIAALGNQYLEQSYQLSLGEYIKAIQPFTSEEKAWLATHNIIKYGADSNSPPLRYVDPETLQYEGIVVDYVDALSIELGVSIDFTPTQWKNALLSLSSGDIDICDMQPSVERAEYYDFSAPIYFQRGVILTHKDSPIQSMVDLPQHTIAGTSGDYIFEYLENNYPSVKAIESTDLESAIALLKDGAVDAVLGDESVIEYFVDAENLSNAYYMTEDVLYEQNAAIAVKKDNKLLLSIINKGIARLKTKNTMDKINRKWYAQQPLITKDIQQFKWQFILETLTILALFSFGVFYYWNRQLTQKVDQRTRDLNASTKVLKTTFNSLSQFLIVLDENKNLIELNDSFALFSKSKKSAFKGCHFNELPPLISTGVLSDAIQTGYSEKTTFECTFEHDHRTYKAKGYPLENPMVAFQLLLFIEDITDTIVQQQQHLQSHKMVAVGQLAAGVAHEIRNPIGLIRNHTYLIRRFLKESMSEDLSESLQVMDQSVERVNSIINNLLNFSKQESLVRTPIELRNFVENILNLHKKQIEKKNAQIHLICDDHLKANLYVESMKHIVMNLLSNALEAIDKGGHLDIQLEIKDTDLHMVFADNGSGIPEHLLTNIFNPFFTTKSPDQGVGLGLYIVYNEVEKLQGAITVNSTVGEGTSFDILIPTEHKTKEAKL